MGNSPSAGFTYGEGPTPAKAIAALRKKVESRGGRMECDEMGVCFTTDANGVHFRVHVTPLAAERGVVYYSATQGVTL